MPKIDNLNHQLIAAYLALGAMGADMEMTDEETMKHDGECMFVERVVGHVPLAAKVAELSITKQMAFPKVFVYDVVESFGDYLRKGGIDADKSAKVAKLVELATEFFEQDCGFMAPELMAL